MSREQWDAVIETNLTSLFNVTKQVVEGMVSKGWGRIINISSVNGQKGQFGQTNYSTAKAGIHGFTMALAQELASKGVTVNTVSPGYIGTDMVRAIKPEVLEKIVGTIPVKRLGEPEDIASAVAFFASDQSSYITGQALFVDGGLTQSLMSFLPRPAGIAGPQLSTQTSRTITIVALCGACTSDARGGLVLRRN